MIDLHYGDIQKEKEAKLKAEIKQNHVETRKYSQRISSAHSRGSSLDHYGVATHYERQFKAQKEKQIVNYLKSVGGNRNTLKKRKRGRVTIPKKRNLKRFLQEAINVISSQSPPSVFANKLKSTQELGLEGFSSKEIIETADDIENGRREEINKQFRGNENIKFDEKTNYSTAVDTLHNYLHSFDL